MSMEARFSAMAQQIGSLGGWNAAYLFLGCSEPELRHPLLGQVFRGRYEVVGSMGSTVGDVFWKDERVCAVRDMALQTGQVQWLDARQGFDKHLKSVVIAPIERPAGVLGFVLLTGSRLGAFCAGERRLLRQYLPQVAEALEQVLADVCIDASPEQIVSIRDEEYIQQRTRTSGRGEEQLLARVPVLAEHDQLLQQQKELERLKHEFISMVSHELRTPLTAIKGYAVLLKAYGLTDGPNESGLEEMSVARQREYVDSIMEQAGHLEVLISDLLDMSRIQAGRISLRNSAVDVAMICQRVVRLVQQSSDQEHSGRYTIRCKLPLDLPCIWADGDRVRQILTNLLENAVKYSPGGGCIEVQAALCVREGSESEENRVPGGCMDAVGSPKVGMVRITVRDQGIGIAQEHFSQLFKPFARLEHPLTTDIPGAGLGLYISRKLVEAMGGEMRLSSSEGDGTSVAFTLPSAEAGVIAREGGARSKQSTDVLRAGR